jgi:hypothetical protein
MQNARGLILGVVLGALAAGAVGVAYASIPDSGGVIHGCYQSVTSANKPLKLLDTSKSATCPSGWKSVNWNQAGLPGSSVVARVRLAAPTTVPARTTTSLPLSGATWTQSATGLETVYLEATVAFTAACAGNDVGISAPVGNQGLHGFTLVTLPNSAQLSPYTFQLGTFYLFEPGVNTSRTMTASATVGSCTAPSDSVQVTGLSADVVGVK